MQSSHSITAWYGSIWTRFFILRCNRSLSVSWFLNDILRLFRVVVDRCCFELGHLVGADKSCSQYPRGGLGRHSFESDVGHRRRRWFCTRVTSIPFAWRSWIVFAVMIVVLKVFNAGSVQIRLTFGTWFLGRRSLSEIRTIRPALRLRLYRPHHAYSLRLICPCSSAAAELQGRGPGLYWPDVTKIDLNGHGKY